MARIRAVRLLKYKKIESLFSIIMGIITVVLGIFVARSLTQMQNRYDFYNDMTNFYSHVYELKDEEEIGNIIAEVNAISEKANITNPIVCNLYNSKRDALQTIVYDNYFISIIPYAMENGRWLSEKNIFETVISRSLSNKYSVGSTVRVYDYSLEKEIELKVVGIIDDKDIVIGNIDNREDLFFHNSKQFLIICDKLYREQVDTNTIKNSKIGMINVDGITDVIVKNEVINYLNNNEHITNVKLLENYLDDLGKTMLFKAILYFTIGILLILLVFYIYFCFICVENKYLINVCNFVGNTRKQAVFSIMYKNYICIIFGSLLTILFYGVIASLFNNKFQYEHLFGALLIVVLIRLSMKLAYLKTKNDISVGKIYINN